MSNEWVKWVNERNFQAIKLSDTATSHSPPVERGLSFVSTFPFVNRQQLHTLNGKSFTYLCITTWINEWPVKMDSIAQTVCRMLFCFIFLLCVLFVGCLLLKPTNHFVRISFGNESNKSVMLHLEFYSGAIEEVTGKCFDLHTHKHTHGKVRETKCLYANAMVWMANVVAIQQKFKTNTLWNSAHTQTHPKTV